MSTVPRLFIAEGLQPGWEIHPLDERGGHYLQRVLRLSSGDVVRLFDGSGGEWEAILHTAGSRTEVRLVRHLPGGCESPLAVTLVHGLSRSAPMELVIQKGVELGAVAVIPLLTKRSVSRPDERQGANKLERWRRIAIEAAEQCGRTQIPHVHAPLSWNSLAVAIPEGTRLLFWEEERHGTGLRALPPPRPGSPVTLLTGPEGGLTADEVAFARDQLGFQTVGMGPRTLRTETAALAVLTMVQTLWGDMG
ncbi:MAG: 16S rRNA (uracil(1498)-N(3))-methyltransferase [Magnetococcales bacterium]|nr:16S rRNA (uracil(1498)-N(3))-methyltransferase [Magnetococcales bacterium]MBF0321956.1 16S rRNA (uracil(1498)-N(3))-methyltransferase [Magnetococcales bacterium]